MLLRYLTHPQVRMDPAVPVPDWGLNEIGLSRVAALAASDALSGTTQVVSSGERKALDTARPLASSLGLEVTVREAMHENDRSATGFLPPEEFERVADAFFARPQTSVRGWERAADAQRRIVAEARAAAAGHGRGDLLLVGHGGVGTLLYCHLADLRIERCHDQPPGGGNVFAFDLAAGAIVHGWMPMESLGAPR